jgi:hypothetical protein
VVEASAAVLEELAATAVPERDRVGP